MNEFNGDPALPWTTSRMSYEARKSAQVWPEGKTLAVFVYAAPEQWMWDRNELFPPAPVRMSPGEPLPSLSSRTAVDYGFEIGIPRVADIFAARDLKLTMWTTGNAAGRYPELIKGLADQGHQIEAHGWSEGQPLSTLSYPQQEQVIAQTTRVIEEVTGSAPRGWIGPGAMATADTVTLLAKHGYQFHCDLQDDELPYFIRTDEGDDLLALPYRMVGNINDLWLLTKHYRSVQDSIRYLKESLDAHLRVAEATPTTFVYGTHPYVSGRPDYSVVLSEFLDYAASKSEVWLASFRDVADWWTSQHGDLRS